MSLKRRFIRIGIGFFIFMLICTFLSRNFRYYMTPKVMTIYPGADYLNYTHQLSGVFMSMEEGGIRIADLFDCPDTFTDFIIVEKIYVEEGQKLDIGDNILTMSIDPSLFEKRDQLSREYNNLRLDREKFEHDLKVGALNLKTQIHRIENEIYKIQDMIGSLAENSNGSRADGAVNSIKRLETEADLYKEEIGLLRKEYSRIVDHGIIGDQSLDMKRQNIEEIKIKIEQIDKFEENFNTTISAEAEGMILNFLLEKGQGCKFEVPLFTWVPSDKIYVGVEVPQGMEIVKTAIEEEETEYMILYGNQQWTAKVMEVDYGQYKTTVLLEPEEELRAQLNISEVEEASVVIDYRTDFYDIVIPNSSIIEKEGSKMVYLVKSRSGFWGTEEYVVLSEITIEKSDATNSAVSRGIQLGDRIASGWDRPLADDQKVIDLNQQ